MIDKSIVEGLVTEWLEGKDYFLVDVVIEPGPRIVVEIDHADGVWIEDCVELSRFIESRLSREEEDYELEVGSAGLGQPFKVARQYMAHVGSEVDVLTRDGRKIHGVLTGADEEGFALAVKGRRRRRQSGGTGGAAAEETLSFRYEDVKHTKCSIKF